MAKLDWDEDPNVIFEYPSLNPFSFVYPVQGRGELRETGNHSYLHSYPLASLDSQINLTALTGNISENILVLFQTVQNVIFSCNCIDPNRDHLP